jgi:hypothetical protein
MLVDSYLSTSNFNLTYPLASKELLETIKLVEEWAYNNPESI